MAKKSRRSVSARRAEHAAQQRRKRITTFIIASGAVVVLAAMAFLIRQGRLVEPEEVLLPESLTPPEDADGSAWGPVDAPVLIEEYSDFQ